MAAAEPLLGLLSAVLGLFMTRRSVKVASKQAWLAYALTISLRRPFTICVPPCGRAGMNTILLLA